MLTISPTSMNSMEAMLRTTIAGCTYLDEAAQRTAEIIYREFEQSMVLTRIYVTLPFEKLPPSDQVFVNKFAAEKQISQDITPKTSVLSLVGTCGTRSEWSDRQRSRGHIGIPLTSTAFVDTMPMIARLLTDLGVALDGVDDTDTAIETQTFSTFGGLFYVPDARTATDQRGRKIINAQDFVVTQGVRAVFGSCGVYFAPRSYLFTMFFTRDIVDKSTARYFMPLANVITAATTLMMRNGKLFST